MKIKKIKKGTIAEEITGQIRGLIEGGSLKPGDRLPSERELAEMFGVGRPSVREAMHSLAFVGVLEIRPGDGTYLSNPQPLLGGQFADSNAVHRYTSFELIEVRQAIEVESASLAALRATDEDKEKIMETCKKAVASRGNSDEYIQADAMFHRAIVEATQNRFLIQILEIARRLDKNPLYYNLQDNKYMQDAVFTHLDIAQAIIGGDAQLARLTMGWHFELMKKSLRENKTDKS